MASTTTLTFVDTRSVADVKTDFKSGAGAQVAITRLHRYLGRLGIKAKRATMAMQVQNGDAVQATGTLTLASVVATDTCAINGVTFTCVASGATGNQFNVGGSDTLSATALKNAINASVSAGISGLIVATSSGAIVTVKAATAGTAGNGYTLTAGTHFTASGARLTTGAADTGTTTTFHFGA